MMRRRIQLIAVVVIFAALYTGTAVQAQDLIQHTVQRGDTLFRIAQRYGVSVEDLIAANAIPNASRILAGQVLTIPGLTVPDSSAEVTNPLVAQAPITHTVQRGEMLSQIALRYNTTVSQILSANNVANANLIYAGQQLQIWTTDMSVGQSAVDAEASSTNTETNPTATHVVQPGEYLSQIARRYGVPWTSIAEANNILDPNRVFAGMTLNIPNATSNTNGDLGIVTSEGPGPRIGIGREVVVRLSTQTTYAYEDGVLKRSTVVSTGLPATPTVQGTFRVQRKIRSQTMSGPGYYLPGVEWVVYFYQGYALHGTYWHNNFGRPMSHGCVNMTNEDAQWFYNFVELNTPVTVIW